MKLSSLTAFVCALAISVFVVSSPNAQEEGGGRSEHAQAIPQLQFRLVPEFFHFPPNSVVGRVSGIAVSPAGNIVTLNRGYHPVQEFKSDGTFVRSWGEGST